MFGPSEPRYAITDTSGIITPALVIYLELVEQNMDEMVRIARDPARLRPHCKTHKMRELAQLGLKREINKGK